MSRKSSSVEPLSIISDVDEERIIRELTDNANIHSPERNQSSHSNSSTPYYSPMTGSPNNSNNNNDNGQNNNNNNPHIPTHPNTQGNSNATRTSQYLSSHRTSHDTLVIDPRYQIIDDYDPFNPNNTNANRNSNARRGAISITPPTPIPMNTADGTSSPPHKSTSPSISIPPKPNLVQKLFF